jgi:hypothetical protein
MYSGTSYCEQAEGTSQQIDNDSNKHIDSESASRVPELPSQ